MGPINQPASQIKLTNVSMVRMKKGKQKFELACYQNKVQDWRKKVEKELDEVLQIPQVFVNVSKGQVASNAELMKAFGTSNTDEVILEILEKGEIQLNEKERNANNQQKQNEFLNIISTKCINPKTKKRFPPSMIQKALGEVNFHLNTNKPPKTQALDAIKLLVEKQVIPIARAQMQVKVVIVNKAKKSVFDELIAPLILKVDDETHTTKTYECLGIIDPVNYRTIVDYLQGEHAKVKNGEGSIEVLNMSALKD